MSCSPLVDALRGPNGHSYTGILAAGASLVVGSWLTADVELGVGLLLLGATSAYIYSQADPHVTEATE